MIVKMMQSMAGPRLSFKPGDLIDVSKEIADAWEKAGIARKMKKGQYPEDDPVHKYVPEMPKEPEPEPEHVEGGSAEPEPEPE